MSSKALEVIENCLSNEKDKPYDWDPVKTFINLRHPDFKVDTLNKYDMNLNSIEILFEEHTSSNASAWDGEFASQIVFSFDKGFALAVNTGWWGPTFTGNTYTIDICEHNDFDLFDRLCLTDDLRSKMVDIQAHRIILNGKL